MKKEKIKFYFELFTLAIAIFLVISTISNCVPFGKYLYNNEDSFYMYPALLVHSIRTLFNGHFFYNINSFLGSDFYNVRTLYMNSPLNLLFILFKKEDIFNFYTMIIFLRVGLSALTMGIYLNSISKNKYTYKQLLFSLLYSLSNYGIACSVHIMWIDSFILLPLIIMGIDKLILENKVKLYITTLTLAILVNFYIGYMICIFCLIYFIYKAYISNQFNKKTVINFLISSLLCGIQCCIVLIPQIISLINGRGHTFDFGNLMGINVFSLLSLPANIISGTYSKYDMFSNGSPLIYCSVFVVVMDILYFFNSKVSKREKKGTLLFLIFFFMSLSINFIDFSWNMFQAPIWFPHRYIFVLVFLLIVIAFKAFEKSDFININNRDKNIIIIIFSILVIVSFAFKAKVMEVEKNYIWGLYISIAIFIIYILCNKSKYYKTIVIFCLFVEIIYNGYSILYERTSITVADGQKYLEIGKYIENIKEYDDSFYRTLVPNSTPNTPMLFDYNSGSLFSSSYDENTRNFLSDKLGYINSNINGMMSCYENPALLSLFGFKYIFGKSTYYDKIEEAIYLNDTALSVGILVPDGIEEIELIDYDYYANIEKIYSSLLKKDTKLYSDIEISDYNIEKYLDDFDKEIFKIKYNFTAEYDGIIAPNNRDLYPFYKIKINDVTYDEQLYQEDYELFYDNLHLIHKGDKVEIEIEISQVKINSLQIELNEKDLGIKLLNKDEFYNAITTLKKYSQMENVNTKNSVIRGEISTNNKGTLVLSIPYQEGFTVYVDDKAVKHKKIFGALTGIEIEEGKHDIFIKYLPKGFKVGVVMSLLGLFFTLIYLKKINTEEMKRK